MEREFAITYAIEYTHQSHSSSGPSLNMSWVVSIILNSLRPDGDQKRLWVRRQVRGRFIGQNWVHSVPQNGEVEWGLRTYELWTQHSCLVKV